MCIYAPISVHTMCDGEVRFIKKVLNEQALEWESMLGLNRPEIRMFENERRSDKPFASV